jgi:hypothetical protein
MKQFIIQQSIDLNLSYVVEANDIDEAMEKYRNEPLNQDKILGIDVLDWDKAWDAEEYTGNPNELTPMSTQTRVKWIEAGVLW